MNLIKSSIKSFWPIAVCFAVVTAAAPAHAARGGEIRVQGPNSTYKIAPIDDKAAWRLKGPGMNGFTLEARPNGSWVVLDPASMIRQRTETTDGRNMKVLDPEGNLRHTVEFTTKGFKVIYPDGRILCRIEIVDDKNFNIYNAKKVLIMTGRSKGKTITVKDVATKQRLFKIKGKISIEDAAFFSVPLQFTETVVIWKTATR